MSRSTVYVVTVASDSASGTCSMSSVVPPKIPTRCGGRWRIPVCRSREPTNPNFQSVERAAADEDGRLGVGLLGGSTSIMFRHVKNLPYWTGAMRAILLATDLARENDALASIVRNSRTWTT